jgi:hypothetical protein
MEHYVGDMCFEWVTRELSLQIHGNVEEKICLGIFLRFSIGCWCVQSGQ